MGYESKLYVVNKTNISEIIGDKTWFFCEKIAEFNLCKVPLISSKMRKYKDTNGYIYADDGNTRIFEDLYGDSLKEIPLSDAIKIIFEAASGNNYYRRYNPCLQLLKGFNLDDWSNLVVLHYGY